MIWRGRGNEEQHEPTIDRQEDREGHRKIARDTARPTPPKGTGSSRPISTYRSQLTRLGAVIAFAPSEGSSRFMVTICVHLAHRHQTEQYESQFLLMPSTIATYFLEQSGVNEFSLFPDLDGLARWLNSRYGFA